MATPLQRVTSVLTGLLDVAPTAAQSNSVADTYVGLLTDDQIRSQYGVERAALTNANKATIVLRAITARIKADMRQHTERVETANAQTAITAAVQAAGSVVPDAP